MYYDPEIARLAAEHAAASAQIQDEIVQTNAEFGRIQEDLVAAFEEEQAASDPEAQRLAAEREAELQRRQQAPNDNWEDDDESEYYRPKSWLI